MANQQPRGRQARQNGCVLGTAGGLFTVIALFFPWFVISFGCGQATITQSLIAAAAGADADYLGVLLAYLPTILGIALIILSILALRQPSFRLAVLHLIASIAELLATFLLTIAVATRARITDFLTGFGLALIGFILSIIGSIFIMSGTDRNPPRHEQRRDDEDW